MRIHVHMQLKGLMARCPALLTQHTHTHTSGARYAGVVYLRTTSSSRAMSRALCSTPCRDEQLPKSHSTQRPEGARSTFSTFRSLQ